jgi:hypothetical protein
MGRLATSSWDAAAETINDLHRLTAVSVKADDTLVERWERRNVRRVLEPA